MSACDPAATISQTDFKKCMNQEFKNKPVNEIMMLALYNRFRPLRMKPDSCELSSEMDVLDFCLGINCLSRCGIDTKIKSKWPVRDLSSHV